MSNIYHTKRRKTGPKYRKYFTTIPVESTSLQLKEDFWHMFFFGRYYIVPFSMVKSKKKKGKNDALKKICEEDPHALGVIITTEEGIPTTGILVCL